MKKESRCVGPSYGRATPSLSMGAQEAARRLLEIDDTGLVKEDDVILVAHAYLLAAEEGERLKADLREANDAIRELQQAACNRDGVPMPSQRPVVERMRELLVFAPAFIDDTGLRAITRYGIRHDRTSLAQAIRTALSSGKGLPEHTPIVPPDDDAIEWARKLDAAATRHDQARTADEREKAAMAINCLILDDERMTQMARALLKRVK